MLKVFAYRLTDGKLFPDEEACKKYETYLKMKALNAKLSACVARAKANNLDAEAGLLFFLTENFPEIERHFKS